MATANLNNTLNGDIFSMRKRFNLISIKFFMAVTGAALISFVTVHLAGNFLIFWGQDALNAYAEKLKSMPLLLWTARLGLIAVFSVHLGLAICLRRVNRQARKQPYVINDPVDTSLASRTMFLSGMVIFAFLIYHLLHFTIGVTNPDNHRLVDSSGRHDVYSMVVLSFRNIYISSTYIVAMLFLGLHLSHAASSIFQTLGITTARARNILSYVGTTLAAVIMAGNISIPLSILLGFVDLPR